MTKNEKRIKRERRENAQRSHKVQYRRDERFARIVCRRDEKVNAVAVYDRAKYGPACDIRIMGRGPVRSRKPNPQRFIGRAGRKLSRLHGVR